MLKKLKEGHWPIFLLSSFSSFANLFLPIILTRILLPEQIGLYKIFFLYMAIIPFFFLTGGPLHSVYYWAGKAENEKKEFLQQSFLLCLILSLLILIIGLPFSSILASYIELPTAHVVLMLFCAFFAIPSSFYSEVNIASGNTVKGSLYSLIFELLKVTSFIMLAYYLKEVVNIFTSFAIILSLKFATTIFLGLKGSFIKFKLNTQKLKIVFKYCLPISISGLLSFFIDKMDQLVLASQLAKDEFAFYSMGCLIIPPLFILEMSVTKVLVPKLSSAYSNNDQMSIIHFRKAISDTAFLIIPAVFGLSYFASPITKLLYTSNFIESAIYLKIFAFSYLFSIIPYDAVPRATGHTNWVLKINLILAPLSLVAILLTSTYSNAKIVLITALSFKLIHRLAGFVYSKNIMNWNVLEMVPWTKLFIFTLIASILTFIASTVQNLFESDINWFLVCSPIFAILYISLLYIPVKRGIFHD